jgi:pimeloyl-ACP methyl ester carboxylesterase
MRTIVAVVLMFLSALAAAQDYEREQRWADQTLPTLIVGNAEWLQQKNGHKFLTLYTEAKVARGAAIIAHGRGWSPDFELYGSLRTKLADAGYTTLSIQLPVLGGSGKIGDYIPLYPDASERFQLAADFLKSRGYRNIAIVSHSLGATMANQYLIETEDRTVRAWVFIGIINGLEEMFRISIPVLDVFGSKDWEIARLGADERRRQIMKNKNSEQVIVPDASHFFERKEDELAGIVVKFLDRVFHQGNPDSAER